MNMDSTYKSLPTAKTEMTRISFEMKHENATRETRECGRKMRVLMYVNAELKGLLLSRKLGPTASLSLLG